MDLENARARAKPILAFTKGQCCQSLETLGCDLRLFPGAIAGRRVTCGNGSSFQSFVKGIKCEIARGFPEVSCLEHTPGGSANVAETSNQPAKTDEQLGGTTSSSKERPVAWIQKRKR